jgi:hypothetical protein
VVSIQRHPCGLHIDLTPGSAESHDSTVNPWILPQITALRGFGCDIADRNVDVTINEPQCKEV